MSLASLPNDVLVLIVSDYLPLSTYVELLSIGRVCKRFVEHILGKPSIHVTTFEDFLQL